MVKYHKKPAGATGRGDPGWNGWEVEGEVGPPPPPPRAVCGILLNHSTKEFTKYPQVKNVKSDRRAKRAVYVLEKHHKIDQRAKRAADGLEKDKQIEICQILLNRGPIEPKSDAPNRGPMLCFHV